MTVSLQPKGRALVRMAITRGLGMQVDDAATFARSRWGAAGDSIVKAAQAAVTSGDLGSTFEAREFFDQVKAGTIVGRMSGLRRVPFNVRLLRVGGTRGYWVSQSAPKPLSKPDMAGSSIEPLKVSAIIAATKEALQEGGPESEAALQRDMERAIVETMDLAFIDANNAGVADKMPAAVTSGVTPIPSSDDPATDLAALVESFAGDLSTAYITSDPVTLTRMALARDSGGAFLFPDLGPRGGSVLGIPVLASRGSPRDSNGGQIALIDPTGIAIGLGGVTIDLSEHASLIMSDSPDTDPGELTSLWQTNAVAWLAEVQANWEVQRAGSVAVVTGATYSTGA
jgi:hypothetical protein